MADTTDTAGLEWSGNFAEGASESIHAADALRSALDKLATASAAYKDPKMAEAAKITAITKELERQAALEGKIAAGIDTGANAAEKMVAKLFSVGAAFDLAVSGAKALYEEIDKVYEKTAALEAEWGSLGAKLAIGQSAKRELQEGIFKKLGGDYEVAAHLGLQFGIGEDKAVEEAKSLLQAKFKESEVPVLIKVAAGMDAVKSGSGAEYLEKLEKLRLEPKVTTKDLAGLWKLGLDSKAVYADLAKTLGVTVPVAMAKVKSGAVDTETVIKAIERAGQKSFGGISNLLEDNVLVMLDRVKGDAEHLFDGVDTSTVKAALKNLIGEIEGGAGAELKGAVADLFGSTFGVALGDFAGKGGKEQIDEVFHAIAGGVHEAAAAVRSLKPDVEALLALFRTALHDGTIDSFIKAGTVVAKAKIGEESDQARALRGKADAAAGKGSWVEGSETIWKLRRWAGTDKEYEHDRQKELGNESENGEKTSPADKAKAAKEDEIHDRAGAGSAVDENGVNAGGADAGNALDDGMAQGIEAGKAKAVNAAAAMGRDSVKAAKDAVGYGSPAEEFIKIGQAGDEGMAEGYKGRRSSAAAGDMADRSADAANDNTPGLPANPGGGGSTSITYGDVYGTFAPQVAIPGGANAADASQAVQQALAAAYPEWLATQRRAQREAQEGVGP